MSDSSAGKVGPRTASGELPRYEELDPLRFQDLCRDLYESERHIATCDVYGTSGQSQQGIDLRAFRIEGGGIDVCQCKCVDPDSLTPSLLRSASKEFIEYLDIWKAQGLRKFVLIVAPDTSSRQIQDEYVLQRQAFAAKEIDYELWGRAQITQRIRPHPGIASTYLEDPWSDRLCGLALPSLPNASESGAVSRILTAQVDVLTGYVSESAESELLGLRNAWRQGRRQVAISGVTRLKEPSRWQAFPARLRAAILRLEAQLALDQGDRRGAGSLAEQAAELDPAGVDRLNALLERVDGDGAKAANSLINSPDPESQTLRAALLLESGDATQALETLKRLDPTAEVHRLRGLSLAAQGNLALARLECNKAVELEPEWHSVRYSRAIVNYFSGLSPAVAPRRIPSWPEPEDWRFVKTDDESRGFFELASSDLALIEREPQVSHEERRTYQAWHVACLANVPSLQEDATNYCRAAVEADPANCPVIIWALARRLSVDLILVAELLDSKIALQSASTTEIVTRIAIYAHADQLDQAAALLEASRAIFTSAGADGLWHLWAAQLGMADMSPGRGLLSESSSEKPVELQLALARCVADSGLRVDQLRSLAQAGSSQATLELVSLLASLGQWREAVDWARRLPDLIGTADVVVLAAKVLYNATERQEALELLEVRRSLFPRSQLPAEMRRLRLILQRELGLLPAATAGAEELFLSEPSRAHFCLLGDLYFEKGDFASLAILARRHQQFRDLTSIEILRLAARVAAEDQRAAAELWRRAVGLGVSDEELGNTVDLGFRLGLDQELRSLLARLYALAGGPSSSVKRIGLEEAVRITLSRRGDIDRILAMYRSGQIPIHFVAATTRAPLSLWFHRILESNESTGGTSESPVFIRHGSRREVVPNFEVGTDLRLHADLTALLLANHLSLLGKVESHFKTIFLPHRTPTAIAEMREYVRPHQPARIAAIQMVHEAQSRGAIHFLGTGADSSATDLSDTHFIGDFDQAVASAVNRDWLFADLAGPAAETATGLPAGGNEAVGLRSTHCLVRSLGVLGEITADQERDALSRLGQEDIRNPTSLVIRQANILIRCSVLEVLASAGVLEQVTRVFVVWVAKSDFEADVVRTVRAARDAEEEAHWLTGLLDRVQRGIDDGTYQLMPEYEHSVGEDGPISSDSPTIRCLLDLLKFPPSPGDVIWADDRWLTSHFHRDGIPVIGTHEVIGLLRNARVVPDPEVTRFGHRLREGDARLCALDAKEIEQLVEEAFARNRSLVETRELRTLRRYYARTLVGAGALRVESPDPSLALEWPFLLASSGALIDAMASFFQAEADLGDARDKAEWILRHLYSPDKGRLFTSAQRSSELDLRLEAATLSGVIFRSMSLRDSDDQGRSVRSAFLAWFHARIVSRRFEADRSLAEACLVTLRTSLSQLVDTVSDGNKNRRAAAIVVIRQFLADMPEELSGMLSDDAEFLGRIGISTFQSVRLGPHRVSAKSLWEAGAQALRSNAAAELSASGRTLRVVVVAERGVPLLAVEDDEERKRYVLDSGLELLSDLPSIREGALRSMTGFFDLPKPMEDEVVARVSSMDDPALRMAEVTRLRRNSVENTYRELGATLKTGQPVDVSQVRAAAPEVVLRNLRIEVGKAHDTGKTFAEQSNRGAETLLADRGLREAIVRMSGLPIAIPSAIVAAVAILPKSERRVLFRTLFHEIGRSPLGAMHLARLCSRHLSDFTCYPRYLKRLARRWRNEARQAHWDAWLAVLRHTAIELSGIETFRALPIDFRLGIVWSHGDRLFRVLTNAGVEREWLKDRFGDWSMRLPDEITLGMDAYTADVAHPKNVNALRVALSGIVRTVADAGMLGAEEIDQISLEIENDPHLFVRLMRDVSALPNALGSFFVSEGVAAELSFLTRPLRERLSADSLRGQVGLAIDEIAAGRSNATNWGALSAITESGVIAPEFVSRLRAALLALDLAALRESDEHILSLAALTASQLAHSCGADCVQHLSRQIVELVGSIPSHPDASAGKRLAVNLLSAPFHLYGHELSGERSSRIAQLLGEMVQAWPTGLAEECQKLVDRLVESLPNVESRSFWGLQISLRSAR